MSQEKEPKKRIFIIKPNELKTFLNQMGLPIEFVNAFFSQKSVYEEMNEKLNKKNQFKPLWYVILHDDSLHSYNYVTNMLQKLFQMTPEQALDHAVELDTSKYTILARLPKDKAMEKKHLIHKWGGDSSLKTQIAMTATIEPVDD